MFCFRFLYISFSSISRMQITRQCVHVCTLCPWYPLQTHRQHHYHLIPFDWCNSFHCNGFLLHCRRPLIDCYVCICKGFVRFAVASLYMWSTHNHYYQKNVSTLQFLFWFITLALKHFNWMLISKYAVFQSYFNSKHSVIVVSILDWKYFFLVAVFALLFRKHVGVCLYDELKIN